jgi:large subunit ribosomal protein L33
MAIKVKMVSTAKTGYFYTTYKSTKEGKLTLRKYDPKTRKHEEFKEEKIKG